MGKLSSTFQLLKEDLYSLGRKRPLGAAGVALLFGGSATYMLGRIPSYLANEVVEPSYTISVIGQHVTLLGAGIWALNVLRMYMQAKKEKGMEPTQ